MGQLVSKRVALLIALHRVRGDWGDVGERGGGEKGKHTDLVYISVAVVGAVGQSLSIRVLVLFILH